MLTGKMHADLPSVFSHCWMGGLKKLGVGMLVMTIWLELFTAQRYA